MKTSVEPSSPKANSDSFLKRLQALYVRLSLLGTNGDMYSALNRRVMLTNQLAITFILLSLPFFFMNALYLIAWLIFPPVWSVLGLVMAFNWRGYTNLSRITFALLALTIFFVIAIIQPTFDPVLKMGFLFLQMGGGACCLMLFSLRNEKLISYGTMIVVFLQIITFYHVDPLIDLIETPFTYEQAQLRSALMVAVGMTLIGFSTGFYQKIAREAEGRIRELLETTQLQYQSLQQQAEEIRLYTDELEATNTSLNAQKIEIELQNHQLILAREALVQEQSARAQAQRMAGIGEISSIIAHEVNTPLSAVLAGAHNLAERISHKLNDSLPEGLTESEAAGLIQLIERAGQAQALSSREERALVRQVEEACEEAGVPNPHETARQLVQAGLHNICDSGLLPALAARADLLRELMISGSLLSQARSIERSTRQASSIVSVLKSYSELASLSPNAGASSTSVADTLPVVLKLYDYFLNQGIEVQLDPLDEQRPLAIDAHLLSQVWTQLTLSSVYGMNRKGLLCIRFAQEANHLLVIWQDNGPSPTDLSAAFEPGVALRYSEPPIDLWICREYVERGAGGRVAVVAPEGGGLAVHLHIPYA